MNLKMTFMAAFASLLFVACSNEQTDLKGQEAQPQATQALSFKINLAQAETFTRKPVEKLTANQKQNLQLHKVEINLTAENFAHSGQWITIWGDETSTDLSYTFENESKEFTLFGLNNPTNLKVRINHLEKTETDSYSSLAPFQLAKAEDIPAYGATNQFEKNQGIAEKDNKKYDKITAQVRVNIPVARIELSGIQVTSGFEAIQLKRIFINKLLTQLQVSPSNSTFSYSSLQKLSEETKSTAVLADQIEQSALDESLAKQVYAYHIFPNSAEEMPQITLEFDQIKYLGQDQIQEEARYAVITKLRGQADFQFEAAKIYRINNMKLRAENIGADITGNSQHALEVKLEIADWEVEDIDDIQWN